MSPGKTGTLLACTSEPITEPVIPSSTAVGNTLSTGASEPMMFIAGSSRRWVIWARIFFIRETGSTVPVNLRAEADTAGGNRFTGVNLAAPIGTPNASW